MPALRTTTRAHDEGTVIELEGDIDIATAERFYEEVVATADKPRARVVLDCDRLSFIDSSGLRALIQCHKTLRESGSQVLVAAPSDRIAKILQVTAVDTRIPVFATVPEALRAPAETSVKPQQR